MVFPIVEYNMNKVLTDIGKGFEQVLLGTYN
jgi:hypothetical protein